MSTKKPTKRIALQDIPKPAEKSLKGRMLQGKQVWGMGVLLVVVGVMMGWGIRQYRRDQRTLEAKRAIWPAEMYVREKNYKMALEGGGGDMGLLEIIERFGDTSVVHVAHFYAGVAYLNGEERDVEEAIRHLEAFGCKDSLMQGRVWGLLGDIYCDRGAYEEAIGYYERAAEHMLNPFTSPEYFFKAAVVYEALQQYEQAGLCYERVYTLFPRCEVAEEARKHGSRVKQLAGRG